jgi:uncharacterized damage-inducible protein DinB
MKRSLQVLALCLALLATAAVGRAQETKGFRADLIGQLEYVQKQVLDLENAIPDAKFTWRPNKEVRSISEVYSHIAFANYMFAKLVGATLPEGIAITSFADETKWEKTSTDKKVIAEQLVKSFDFLKNAIKNMPDANLENMVDFFGNKMTERGILMVVLSHTHEHLGQSIAYARMQGVVPPWTAARMAAEKAKK